MALPKHKFCPPPKPKATIEENSGKYCKCPSVKEILPPLEQPVAPPSKKQQVLTQVVFSLFLFVYANI